MIKTLITGCVVCSLALVENGKQVKVVDVFDGNTLEVREKEGEQYQVVLSEVDAPEIGQDYGHEAREYVERAVKGKKVTMEVRGKDRLGNPLVYIYLKKGKSLGTIMLEEGLAWVKNDGVVGKDVMEEAKGRKVGLWAFENPEPPWIYKRRMVMKKPKSN